MAGIPGQTWSVDTSDMLVVATKFHGNIAQIAKHYDVSRDTIYEYLNRTPEGKEIIKKVRSHNTESDLDLAELVIRYNMTNHESNAGLAQRAAEKVIDKKGQSRGWVTDPTSEEQNDSTKAAIANMHQSLMSQLSDLQSTAISKSEKLKEEQKQNHSD